MAATSQENMTHKQNESSVEEFIIKSLAFIKYLFANWVFLVLFGLLGSAIGLGVSIIKKPIYIATTTFVLEEGEKGGALGGLGGLASIAGIDLGGGGGLFQGDNIIGLYTSRLMIQKALLTKATFGNERKLLIDRFIEFNELKKKWTKTDWTKADFSDTSKFTVVQDSVLREVVKLINTEYLNVGKPDKKLSKIEVNVRSKDEAFAKAFADEIVHAVNLFYVQTKTKRSSQNVAILQHKTDSVRAVMNGAIYAASKVSDATPNQNSTRMTQRVAPIQRAQFSAETNKAVLAEFLKTLEMSKANLLKETPLIQMIDYPILPLEKERIGKAKAMILGGILFGFLGIVYLIIKSFIKNINFERL